MASPTVPHLTLNAPKKRPAGSSLQSPTSSHNSSKRRKPSSAGPSHLRQTSFPPEPSSGVRSPSVESSIVGRNTATPSVLSGTTNTTTATGKRAYKKRKGTRGGSTIDDAASNVTANKSSAVRAGTGSAINGEGGGPTGGGEDEDGEDDDLDEARNQATLEGGKMSEAAQKQEREHLAMLLEAFTPEQADRYDMWRRVKLRKDSVRRLVNHTLSQSVPASVVTTVSGYTKVMIGELIERARDVQLQWQAAAERLPTGQALADDAPMTERINRMDRGPLTPDHLREALRRYRKEYPGGGAGYTGLSLKGKEIASARMGGRKLFR